MTVNHPAMPEHDPYASGLVSHRLRIVKNPVPAKAVGILSNFAHERKMGLISSSSRAVREKDVHELVCTTQNCQPGGVVDDVGYLAFAAIGESGVIVVGDILQVDGEDFGSVLGFNEVHAPNHINIVIRVEDLTSGIQAGWLPGTKLVFIREEDENTS
jgi:hypothetical protein